MHNQPNPHRLPQHRLGDQHAPVGENNEKSSRFHRYWLACAVLFFLALLAGCSAPAEEAEPEPTVAVQVGLATTRDVELFVSAPATLFPLEQATLASRGTGPLQDIRVQKGDRVQEGEIVAQLLNNDLLAQQQEAAAAVVDFRTALQRIQAGTLPATVETARGQVANAEAAWKQAQILLDKDQILYDAGVIPQQTLLASQTAETQTKATLDVAKKNLDLLLSQSNELDIKAAQAKLDQAEARLKNIEAQISFSSVRSPFSGTITDQFVYPGDMAQPNKPLFTVMNLSSVVARGQVANSDIRNVRVGQACVFESQDIAEPRRGHITVVNQAVDPIRRTVEVWCEIPNSDSALKANIFGTLDVITGQAPNGVIVPTASVQFDEGSLQTGEIATVDPNSKVEWHDVMVGQRLGEEVYISKGISPGAEVIVQGAYGLEAGTNVSVTPGATAQQTGSQGGE